MPNFVTRLQAPGLVLLSPTADVPSGFNMVHVDPVLHNTFLAKMQRLRGQIYLDEAAIEQSSLSPDGRHVLPADSQSWHLLAVDAAGQPKGCVRYLAHPNTVQVEDLALWPTALSESREWGRVARSAVEAEIQRARELRVRYVEVGGWAVIPESRWTITAARIALATYSLAQMLGGCIGIASATVRNSSASILRRVGARLLAFDGAILPPYFEPKYGCMMELLRFDSHAPCERYRKWVADLQSLMGQVPVICARPAPSCPFHGPALWAELGEAAVRQLTSSLFVGGIYPFPLPSLP